MCLIMFALSFSTPLPKEFHARSTKKYLMSIAPSDLLPFFDATTESLKWTWFRADKINTFIDTVYCMSMQKSKALKALLDQLDTQKSE